ncbi:MAG TPA: glutamate synthase subunit beta [Candidatus Methanoperedens sp.]|nr:glutamate synthase subunit beta [Candidatus Methanoperedens sp.]
MGKTTGFIEYPREDAPKRPVDERVRDFREIEVPLPEEHLRRQAGRCMDCGVPYCHSFGCPLANRIPDWNDMVWRRQWRRALELLHATNNLPEVTGRICPATCEAACTLGINAPPVSIRQIELAIVEHGWREGWIVPQPAPRRTGKKAVVVGSGPAGLAAAQQLARAGHAVDVYEKADRPGGILRYGIPDFKLEKWVLDRRLAQMEAEGIVFETRVEAGRDVSVNYLRRTFDAIVVAAGSRVPRDVRLPGRDLDGVHLALDYLTAQNRRIAGDAVPAGADVTACGKRVVVIGGGDTGADCVGTARRQGANAITQVEILPEPPRERAADNPWPHWPQVLRTGTSHDEGCTRLWGISTKEILGDAAGRVRALLCVKVAWGPPDAAGRRSFEEVAGSAFELPADFIIFALGFVHTEHSALVTDFGLELNPGACLLTDAELMTSAPGVFAAGDCVLGARLIVTAIDQGRRAAAAADRWLRVR